MLVDDTAAHIQPALSWQASTVGHNPNYTGVDGRYDGTMRVVVSREADVRLAKDRLPTLEAAITDYWRQQGFQLQIGHATDGNFAIDATKDQVHLVANSDAPWGITISADVGTVKGPKDINSVDGSPIPDPTGSNGTPISPAPSVDPYWSH
ncbi:hypothetical protein SAMN05414137_11084 [Streptacidiphilus jiangxiensis]|uniref:Uncharacterized protein n=1 Tax=Streptacidiphilus jiangxiensis TaxID=235985 RepID=A0A1H7REH7_STRJI|nr:hypothetical protein SAMN05414137_11084 [Streptacidiphilus jiangxiensis]